MTPLEAKAIAGSLGTPSKMPGYAWGIPVHEPFSPISLCKIGGALMNVEGSTCSVCYAMKGRYIFSKVQKSYLRRLHGLDNPEWIEAMVYLLKRQNPVYKNREMDVRHFRWLDSGDLQHTAHLRMILEVCERCPEINFWMSTREYRTVLTAQTHWSIPSNLVIRVSAPMIDGPPPTAFRNTSTVHWRKPPLGYACPASQQEGRCGSCRACWNPAVTNVSYPKH